MRVPLSVASTRLLVALLLAGGSGAAYYFVARGPFNSDSSPIRKAQLQQFEKLRGTGYVLSEQLKVRNDVCSVDILVEYAYEMKGKGSGVLVLRYDYRQKRTPNSTLFVGPTGETSSSARFPVLDRDTQVVLSSSAFDIAPAASVKKDKNTLVPAVFKWTYTPKGEGQHHLLLDVSDIVLFLTNNIDPKVGAAELLIDGQPMSTLKDGIIELPVSVGTEWGVSTGTAQVISWALAFFSFLVSYPLVTEWLKRRLLENKSSAEIALPHSFPELATSDYSPLHQSTDTSEATDPRPMGKGEA